MQLQFLSAQHLENYYLHQLDQKWIKENQVRVLEVEMRFPNRKGKLKKKGITNYINYNSDGYLIPDNTVLYERTDTSVQLCQLKEKFMRDTLCIKYRLDKSGRIIKLEGNSRKIEYELSSDGRILMEKIDKYNDFDYGKNEIVENEYDSHGLIKRKIHTYLKPRYQKFSLPKSEDEIERQVIMEYKYQENRVVKVVMSERKSERARNWMAKLIYKYDKQGKPIKRIAYEQIDSIERIYNMLSYSYESKKQR